MKLEKRKNLHYVGSPHTSQGTTDDMIDISQASDSVQQCITKNYSLTDSAGNKRNVIRFNFNNIGSLPITRYTDYLKAMNIVLSEIGAKEIYWTRVDFRLDSDNPTYFNEFYKLHKLLISCLAIEYKTKNNYSTNELFSGSSLNVAMKAETIAVENYDKVKQSEGKDLATARFEERSIKLRNKDIRDEFERTWVDRWKKAITRFEEVQERYNNELEFKYKSDLSKPKRLRRYLNLTAFLLENQENIFTKKQLVNLLGRFEEVKTPLNRATNFKRQHSIEFFSVSDLNYCVREIEKATKIFFAS